MNDENEYADRQLTYNEQVIKYVEDCGNKYKVGLVMLDIKNAFNSASWASILKALGEKDIPTYP